MQWNFGLPEAKWYTRETPGLEALAKEIADNQFVAIDTETTGLDIVRCIPLYWSLAWRRRSGEMQRCTLRSDALQAFQSTFRQEKRTWILANAKFDAHMLANVSCKLEGNLADTQAMHAMLYEESPHGLKDMNKQLLGWQWASFRETFGKTDDKTAEVLQECERTNLQKLVEYAANDAYATFRLYEKLAVELEETKISTLYPELWSSMWDLFWKTEMPYTRVLWKCERKGIRIDRAYMEGLVGPMQARMDVLSREITRLAGKPLNLNAPAQLVEYFVKQLGLKPLSMTKGGKSGNKQPQVNEAFFSHYADDYPIAKCASEWKDIKKTRSTYIDSPLELADQDDRVHTTFNQHPRTGRISSSGPNLQNLKRPEEDDFHIRRAYIAKDEDHLLGVFDYNALEMRLLAAAAMDKDMTAGFLAGKDVHMSNAHLIFGERLAKKHSCPVDYDDFVKAKKIIEYAKDVAAKVAEGKATVADLDRAKSAITSAHKDLMLYRGHSKTVSFALIYGMGVDSLAKRLKVDVPAAQDVMDSFMKRFPAVQTFMKECVEETRQTGYSFTVIGRRRFLPEILSSSKWERAAAERKATNLVVQGTAADVMRLAMLKIDAMNLDTAYGIDMLLQVHDELVFDVPKKYKKIASEAIHEGMEHSLPRDLMVPLTISGGFADTWEGAK